MTTGTDVPARRRSPRIPLVCTAAVTLRGNEYLCKTCNMSDEGIGVVLRGVETRPGEPIQIVVLFGGVLKTFHGVIAFTRELSEASLVGIHFGPWPSPKAIPPRQSQAAMGRGA